jgi:hypothetical protein
VGLFRRRRPAPAAATATAAPGGASVGLPMATVPGAHGPGGLPGIRGWAGLGYVAPSAYAGAYSGDALTQRGSSSPGVQMRNGMEGLSSGWYTPPTTQPAMAPYPWLATQRGSSAPGPQRTQGAPSGGMGPITARAMRGQITRAQVLQSGLSVTQWARQLPPTFGA